jgi:DNA-binding NarL/FixJ family response regulator
MSHRLLVVEDQADTARQLVALLAEVMPGTQVQVAGSVAEARAANESARWDLALVDLGLPDGSGLDVIRALRLRQPAAEIAVLSVHDDDHHLFTALAAGARGYLLKEQPPEMVALQLSLWLEGQPPLSPRMARRLLAHFHEPPPAAAPVAGRVELTPRETDVLACIGRGLRVRETADALGIAPSTVMTYVKSIYGKLDIRSRAEAALEASRRGLNAQPG